MKLKNLTGDIILTILFIFILLPCNSWADPPSSFDLRNVGGVNYVSSVKSQTGGTCWTHGVMAAIEGNLLMTGNWEAAGESGEPNLAEYHLDWWNGFNENNNDDLDPPSGSGLIVHEGGDYRVASAYLNRGEGAVRDIDGQSYDTPPARYDPSYHYNYVRDIEWFVVEPDLSNINTVKEKIMTNGVIGTCMCYSSSFMQNYIHYQPGSSELDPNHAVAIVGWDDDKVTQAPEGNGAWLCKNSWGTSWGLNGYFWISYYDKHCCKHPEMGAISFQNVEPFEYDHVYYHDYHGWRDTKTDCAGALNAFTATENELLKAISFYTAQDSVNYTVIVYDRFEGGELLDELSTKSGFIEFTGFHTIELDSSITLSPGNDFYIYLELSEGGYAFDRTSDVPVLLAVRYTVTVPSTSHPGESYYRSGSTWSDLYGFNETANFCIKALAVTRGLRISPADDLHSQGSKGGPFTPSSKVFQLENKDSQAITYAVTCDSANWVTLSGDILGTLQPKQTAEVTAEINSSAEALGEGIHFATIYFTNTTNHFGDATRRVQLAVGEPMLQYEWELESDPGWTIESDWAYGQPTGSGGEHGGQDPTSGHTGTDVYGYNLQGDYPNNLPEAHLTSNSIDCSDLYNVHLKFWRWLGVEQPFYDHAYVRVSSDGINWTTIWQNTSEVTDYSWTEMDLDISAVADNQPTVYLRWTMGTTDAGWSYCGWNIDDIQVVAYEYGVVPGDANGDGNVSVSDVVYIINYLFKGGPAPDPLLSSDVDCNGNVNVSDVIYLINYLFKGGPPPGC